MRTQQVLRKMIWLAQCVGFVFVGLSAEARDAAIIKFQESSASTSARRADKNGV
jgi:hypothetical protein